MIRKNKFADEEQPIIDSCSDSDTSDFDFAAEFLESDYQVATEI